MSCPPDEPEAGWLCSCGAAMDHDFHCDECGSEPPWGCGCNLCEPWDTGEDWDDYLDEDLYP